MNVKPFHTFVLDSYIRIGDRVAVLIDRETRGWAGKQYEHIPDGTEGTVIGFNRNVKYVNRNRVYDDKPGKYKSNGLAIVKWDNGGNDRMSAHHIGPVNQLVHDFRRFEVDYKKAFDMNEYICPLPELPYWEGDIVKTKESMLRAHGGDNRDLIITSIDYYHLDQFCNDGVTPMPIYDVKLAGMTDSPMTRIRESDIEALIDRGNYWKLEHEEPLVFKDINEKLDFYNSIGQTQQVRNPRNNAYAWQIDEVAEAIKAKTVDYCVVGNSLFGTPIKLNAYVIPNHPDIAEEARANFRLEDFQN